MTQLQSIKHLLHSAGRLGYVLSSANSMTNHERFQQCKTVLAAILDDTLVLKENAERSICQRQLERERLALTQDGIKIALVMAGYKNVGSMTGFEQACALQDMAREVQILASVRGILSKGD